MTPLRSLASSAGMLAAFALPAVAQVAPSPVYQVPSVATQGITWSACTDQDADPAIHTLLGDRLRCGTVSAPRDHHRPADGSIRLRVLRVAAADAAKRQGTLFVNPGGPGGDPRQFAAMLAAIWMHAKPDDRVHGEKKRMADAFDLVAVVPRGMPGSAPLTCAGEFPDARSILLDRTPRNIARWDLLQRRLADACRADPLHPYISTEQTVYDLDLVRRALGESTFNYLGTSYGTWLGAWYGATYPDKVGRMLLDSSMDYTSSMEENFLLTAQAEQERFDRLVVKPAVAASALYGLGEDQAAVRGVLATMPYRVQRTWTGEYRSPESLKAALAMSEWLRVQPELDRDSMATRIATDVLHPDAEVNQRIRAEASRMLAALYTPAADDTPSPLPAMSAMLVAVPCNDTPGTRDAGIWHETIARYARDYPAARSGDLVNACVFWPGPNAVKPPVERLARAGQILIIASEHDTVTPVSGALRMVNALPNASLLVLRGSDRHSVFTLTDEACVERTGARFLLDGRKPTEQLTECQVDGASAPAPTSATPQVTRFTDTARVQQWRDRLDRLFGQKPRLYPSPRSTSH